MGIYEIILLANLGIKLYIQYKESKEKGEDEDIRVAEIAVAIELAKDSLNRKAVKKIEEFLGKDGENVAVIVELAENVFKIFKKK